MSTEINKYSKLYPFVFTIIGIIVGAGFQYVANLSLEKSKYLEESKKNAYIDFLNAQQKYYEADSLDDKKEAARIRYEYNIEMAAAKKRIAIYGGKKVAEAVANFYLSFNLEKCPQSDDRDINIYKSMRAELLPKSEQISNTDLSALLFNCKYETSNRLY